MRSLSRSALKTNNPVPPHPKGWGGFLMLKIKTICTGRYEPKQNDNNTNNSENLFVFYFDTEGQIYKKCKHGKCERYHYKVKKHKIVTVLIFKNQMHFLLNKQLQSQQRQIIQLTKNQENQNRCLKRLKK